MPRFILAVALALSFGVAAGAAAEGPKLEEVSNPRSDHGGWVSDGALILGAALPELEQRFARLNQETGHEVALVILPSIGDAVPRTFANELFERWGVGRQGEDDGVLILHVLDQRRVEVETGYGAEALLPDAKCAWLVNEVAVPLFREDKLAQGHLALAAGVDAALRDPALGHDQLLEIARTLAQSSAAPIPAGTRGVRSREQPGAWGWLLAAFGATLAAQLLRRRAHRACNRGQVVPVEGPSGFLFGLLVLGFVAFCETGSLVPRFSIAAALLLAVVFTVHALAMFVRARRRFTRTCTVCHKAMALLDDKQTCAQLTPGQQTEYKLGAVWYLCFRCPNGHSSVEQSTGPKPLRLCRFCGCQTERDLGTRIVQQATASADGREERTFSCHHCNESRVEITVVARPRPPSRSRGSSSDSTSSSSWESNSSSSSSSSSSSFGGGSSGGGGAGGSY
jgi:uncharacterized protein